MCLGKLIENLVNWCEKNWPSFINHLLQEIIQNGDYERFKRCGVQKFQKFVFRFVNLKRSQIFFLNVIKFII